MKYLPLFLVATVGLFAAKAQAQPNIYDTVNTGAGLAFYGGPGNNVAGDNYLPPAAALGWTANDLEFVVVATAPGLYNATVNMYDVVNAGPPPVGPAFGNLALTITGQLNIPPGAFPAAFLVTATGLGQVLPNPPGANGLGIEFIFDNAPNMSIAYSNAGSVVVGSAWSNGFFVDLSLNGALENNEFVNFGGWTNGNAVFSLEGTSPMAKLAGPVPGETPQWSVRRLPGTPRELRPMKFAPSVADAIPPHMLKS
jgi:hypothetical protein